MKTKTVKNQQLPITCFIFGRTFMQKGIGAYPYECMHKDEHPNAMVYHSDKGGWTTDTEPAFLMRDKSQDVFDVETARTCWFSTEVGKKQNGLIHREIEFHNADNSIVGLVKYGKTLGVAVILHYETFNEQNVAFNAQELAVELVKKHSKVEDVHILDSADK